eukprot:TRINITY_DN1288_c0_g1_i18.p1 TRINITY_DN1288_c0_g1~~TRINITY_DN1288_c0_g1_i18.p1  ORF type:complete len:233 (+),score=47.08 TRINITY_DN1288_c0_g1_i18:1-699(+)
MEILRRMHLRGAHQFFMSTNRVIYLPFSEMWFYRRALDYRKMLDLELVSVPEGSSVDKEEELHKITESALIPGMRLMAKEDVPQVHALLTEYLKKFTIHAVHTEEQTAHLLLPREEIVYTYVVADANNKITDFVSFTVVYYSVLKHPTIKQIKTIYPYYYAYTKTPLAKLMNAALYQAIKLGAESCILADNMDNSQFAKELKFMWLNDCQQVYIYNYMLNSIPSSQLGINFL